MKVKPIPKISEAETIVMETLWSKSPQSAEDICLLLAQTQYWQESTIKTLLNRLLKKEAVAVQLEGRRYLYSPTFDREQWQTQESDGFIDRVFGGQVAPLFAHLSQHKRLSSGDLKALKKLIEGMKDGK